MPVKTEKWGDSIAVRLPRAVVDALRLEAGANVDPDIAEGALVVSPAPPGPTLAAMLAEADRIGWGKQPALWPDEDWSDIASPEPIPNGSSKL